MTTLIDYLVEILLRSKLKRELDWEFSDQFDFKANLIFNQLLNKEYWAAEGGIKIASLYWSSLGNRSGEADWLFLGQQQWKECLRCLLLPLRPLSLLHDGTLLKTIIIIKWFWYIPSYLFTVIEIINIPSRSNRRGRREQRQPASHKESPSRTSMVGESPIESVLMVP